MSTPSQVGVTRSTCIARCCSQGPADAAGSQRTWIESCNAKCSCGSDDVRVQLVPVCVNDAARRYYSPCHAGCSRLQQTSDGRIVSSYSYILQANEQNIKISIKQTQTQPQYSMPHGRRRYVVTPLTRDPSQPKSYTSCRHSREYQQCPVH